LFNRKTLFPLNVSQLYACAAPAAPSGVCRVTCTLRARYSSAAHRGTPFLEIPWDSVGLFVGAPARSRGTPDAVLAER